MRSVCVAWRFAALVGFIKAGVRDLFADLIHHGVDLAPHHQIVGALRRHAAQMRQHNASDLVNQFIDMVWRTSSRCFSAMRMRSSAAFAFACSASALLRGDCRRSRGKYRG